MRSRTVLVRFSRVLVRVDAEFRRGHAGAQDAIRVDVRVAEGEAAERFSEIRQRQAGVQQRAERHVARNAREAVEIQHAAHRVRVSLKL